MAQVDNTSLENIDLAQMPRAFHIRSRGPVLDGNNWVRFMPAKTAGRSTGWKGILVYAGRINSQQEAERLQYDYFKFYAQLASITERKTRYEFFDAPHDVDAGKIVYTMEGQVVDTRADFGDRVSRICLLFPKVVGPDGEQVPVDSHIWLLASGMRYDSRIVDTHSKDDDEGLSIRIGETLKVQATIRAYEDKHGRHRFGIDIWRPLSSRLTYWQWYRDRRRVLRMVDKSVATSFEVVHVLPRHRPVWRNNQELHVESLAVYKRIHDLIDFDFFTMDPQDDGWPKVTRLTAPGFHSNGRRGEVELSAEEARQCFEPQDIKPKPFAYRLGLSDAAKVFAKKQ